MNFYEDKKAVKSAVTSYVIGSTKRKFLEDIDSVKDQQDFFNLISNKDHSINWEHVFRYGRLSQKFIEKFQYKPYVSYVVKWQNISEDLISKVTENTHHDIWGDISEKQKLSEKFILKYKNKVYFNDIFKYQKLSEKFILKYHEYDEWNFSEKYQKLSEEFILKNIKLFNLERIIFYQKLSNETLIKFHNAGIEKPSLRANWLYATTKYKKEWIKENTNYKIQYDSKKMPFIIAYKGIRSDRFSQFNFQYQYLQNKTYESHCDCNLVDRNSFGLSAWNYEYAKNHCPEKVVRVKIFVKDIGAILKSENNKIRCFKFKVLD